MIQSLRTTRRGSMKGFYFDCGPAQRQNFRRERRPTELHPKVVRRPWMLSFDRRERRTQAPTC